MLSKVDRVTNIGRFQVLQHKAEGFRRLGLLFARNGFGKSTICAVIRSASQQDPRLISEREHLDSSGPPSATLQFTDSGTVAYNNGSWNRQPPPLMLFDQDFVRANVHVAEEVTADNKRSLLRVIIGAPGVALFQRLNDLDAEGAELLRDVRQLEEDIIRHVPAVRNVAEFVAAERPDDLGEKIAAARRTLAQALRREEIMRRSKFHTLTVGSEPQTLLDLLCEGMDGSLAEADEVVGAHIAKHQLGGNGRRWLSYGVDHNHGTDCPFCDQDVSGSIKIESYRKLFSDDYKTLSARLETADVIVGLAASGATSLSAQRLANDENFLFWSSVVELVPLGPAYDVDWHASDGLLAWLAAALKIKADNPALIMEVPQEKKEAWSNFLEVLRDYNSLVVASNDIIQGLKEAAWEEMSLDAERARDVLQTWLSLQRRGEPEIEALCKQWSAYQGRRSAIVSEKKAAQLALRQHTTSAAAAYEDGINSLLEDFGANFRFCQAKANYVGGANVQYCIDLNGKSLDSSKSGIGGKPSFRTVLSSGDKMTLALALFITQARQRDDISDLVLVFDDPFSSQDAGRQFETSARIRELAATAKQAIVLSHDARFLRMLAKDSGALEFSEHQITMEADWKGKVCVWSAESEVRSDYVRRAERIRAYASTGQHLPDCSPSLLAGDIRIFLEEYLDIRFPGRFASSTLLGAMIDQIDQSVADPLYNQRLALREINEFARPDHHRGTAVPDPTQLRAQCRKIVKIIGTY